MKKLRWHIVQIVQSHNILITEKKHKLDIIGEHDALTYLFKTWTKTLSFCMHNIAYVYIYMSLSLRVGPPVRPLVHWSVGPSYLTKSIWTTMCLKWSFWDNSEDILGQFGGHFGTIQRTSWDNLGDIWSFWNFGGGFKLILTIPMNFGLPVSRNKSGTDRRTDGPTNLLGLCTWHQVHYALISPPRSLMKIT